MVVYEGNIKTVKKQMITNQAELGSFLCFMWHSREDTADGDIIHPAAQSRVSPLPSFIFQVFFNRKS